MLSQIAVVLTRVTLLLGATLLFLRMSRGLPPQVRHLACVLMIGPALSMMLLARAAALSPDQPIFAVRALEVADVSGVRISPSSAWTWVKLAWVAWWCGCAVVLFRFLIGTAILWRVRHNAAPVGSDPRVLSADVSVPMVTGLFRPMILMPRDAANWTGEQRDAALRHEQAHLERRDLRWNFFALLLCAIYWFHPLAWMVFRRIREEQEAACDDLVIEGGFDRAVYAQALLDVSRRARFDGTFIASCPMTRRVAVKERILRVLSPGERMAPKTHSRWQTAVSGGVLFVLIAAWSVGTEPIYAVGGNITAPVLVRRTSPAYTGAAKAAKISGTVQLNMVIGTDGVARDIVVVRGIDAGLDHSAVASVHAWKFQPAMLHSSPVAVRARIDVNFRLK